MAQPSSTFREPTTTRNSRLGSLRPTKAKNASVSREEDNARKVAELARAASRTLAKCMEADKSAKLASSDEGSLAYQRQPTPDHDLQQCDRQKIVEDTVQSLRKLMDESKMEVKAFESSIQNAHLNGGDQAGLIWPETTGSHRQTIDFSQRFFGDSSSTSAADVREIEEYILHCAQGLPRVSVVAMALAATYMERLSRAAAPWKVAPYNFKRLYITAFGLAHKFLDDQNYSNPKIASVGGISKEELNSLERQMVTTLAFRMAATATAHYELGKHRRLSDASSLHSKLLTDKVMGRTLAPHPHSRL